MRTKKKNSASKHFTYTCYFSHIGLFGASGTTTGKSSIKICKFLGDISYPLYMVHYPFMYLFYAWVWQENLTFTQIWPITLLLFLGTILVAYLFLKLYDEPFRKWLSKKLLMKS
ncbi:acyltransferase family protein [Olivibacter jilunii]|uniref:acyltransferase family protein n=1 Tax=Olivibacter jilunii TaxID=985016 RepID=UPI003F1851BC